MTGIEVEKFKVNLNTIVAFIGFLGTFGLLTTMWNDALNEQRNTSRWIEQHNLLHEAIAKDLSGLHATDQTGASTILDLTFRVAQLEKGSEGADTRISRITESYGNQFTDIRGALSGITTQLALTNQSLQRLEVASGKLSLDAPRELK